MRNAGKEAGTVLHIKNMVCNRCIMAVEGCLKQSGLHPAHVELGTAVISEELTDEMLGTVRNALEALGFELIDDRKSLLIEQIRSEVIKLVHYGGNGLKVNLSEHLSSKLNRDYSSLSKLFSETYGSTIEHYCIAQKVERAKELLANGELTVSQIADCLGYSSVAHLSAQFSRQAGMTPSAYRKLKEKPRLPLDKIR